MFDKKTKKGLDFGKPKFTTFGNDSDLEEEITEEIPNVDDLMKKMDSAISAAKQNEANATIKKVYSGQPSKPAVKVVNACGCFGGNH